MRHDFDPLEDDEHRSFWAEFILDWIYAILFVGLAWGVFSLIPPARAEPLMSSYYGSESGTRNADGSRFNPAHFTAAHRTYAFGTKLRVCYRGCVQVVVRDRGPAPWTGRSLDLSRGAAKAIGMERVGVAIVQVEKVD